MGRKRRTAEEIVGHLREVEVCLAKGETIGIAWDEFLAREIIYALKEAKTLIE